MSMPRPTVGRILADERAEGQPVAPFAAVAVLRWRLRVGDLPVRDEVEAEQALVAQLGNLHAAEQERLRVSEGRTWRHEQGLVEPTAGDQHDEPDTEADLSRASHGSGSP
jgi:hypothetical protein